MGITLHSIPLPVTCSADKYTHVIWLMNRAADKVEYAMYSSRSSADTCKKDLLKT
jgi:hypothetical protein